MHENRETSATPAAQSSRTAGEGSGRTTRMYVAEESDSDIVPMNHSNKIEQSIAESEEGRPLIKENTPSKITSSLRLDTIFHLYGWAAGPCVTRKLSLSWCEQVRSAQ
jgi:hypothetical protein